MSEKQIPENCYECQYEKWITTPMYRPICTKAECTGGMPLCAALKGISQWCPLLEK